MEFLKNYAIVITITIGLLGLLLAFISYLRNRRIDKESKISKEESKRKESEEDEKRKKIEKETLLKSKLENLPKFGKGEGSSSVVIETTIEHYLHNFGQTAKNLILIAVDDEVCYISIEPRGIKNFNKFDRITVTIKGKNNIGRDKLKFEYELAYEDVLGNKYKQVIKGTAMNGYSISDPIEII